MCCVYLSLTNNSNLLSLVVNEGFTVEGENEPREKRREAPSRGSFSPETVKPELTKQMTVHGFISFWIVNLQTQTETFSPMKHFGSLIKNYIAYLNVCFFRFGWLAFLPSFAFSSRLWCCGVVWEQ